MIGRDEHAPCIGRPLGARWLWRVSQHVSTIFGMVISPKDQQSGVIQTSASYVFRFVVFGLVCCVACIVFVEAVWCLVVRYHVELARYSRARRFLGFGGSTQGFSLWMVDTLHHLG